MSLRNTRDSRADDEEDEDDDVGEHQDDCDKAMTGGMTSCAIAKWETEPRSGAGTSALTVAAAQRVCHAHSLAVRSRGEEEEENANLDIL